MHVTRKDKDVLLKNKFSSKEQVSVAPRYYTEIKLQTSGRSEPPCAHNGPTEDLNNRRKCFAKSAQKHKMLASLGFSTFSAQKSQGRFIGCPYTYVGMRAVVLYFPILSRLR